MLRRALIWVLAGRRLGINMARITRKQVTVFLSVIGVGMVAFAGTLLETALNVTFPTLMTTFGVPLRAIQLVPAEMGPDANAVLNTAQQYSGAVGIAAASSWLTGAAHCAGQYGNVVGIMAIVGLLIWANWTRLVSRK